MNGEFNGFSNPVFFVFFIVCGPTLTFDWPIRYVQQFNLCVAFIQYTAPA